MTTPFPVVLDHVGLISSRLFPVVRGPIGISTATAATSATRTTPNIAVAPTKDLVLQALRASRQPMSSAEVSTEIGVSRATAQRYLSTLANSGEVKIQLRYGTTGRPEQEFVAADKPPARPARA